MGFVACTDGADPSGPSPSPTGTGSAGPRSSCRATRQAPTYSHPAPSRGQGDSGCRRSGNRGSLPVAGRTGLRIDELCHLRVSGLRRYRVENGERIPDGNGSVWVVDIIPHDPEGNDVDMDDPSICGCQHCRSPRGWIPKGTSRDPRKNRSIRTLEIPADRHELRVLTSQYRAVSATERRLSVSEHEHRLGASRP